MKSKLLVLILFLTSSGLFSQDLGEIENSNSRLFQIIEQNDTINFIKLSSDTLSVKPVLVVLQGSLPIPLGIKYAQGISFTSFPYQLTKENLSQYHIVAISMPNVPVIVAQNDIKENGTYKNVSSKYNKANYLSNYINRANSVIDFLSQQTWVKQNAFILFGHSQGSYIAIKVGKENPKVAKIGISSCSPYGRYHQYISRIRFQENQGVITSVEAQNKIDEYYKRWKHISQNRFDDSQERGDTFKATFSFSENFVDDILDLRIPIFIAYGTKDLGALGCDFLPIEFDRISKRDYKLDVYPGLGHNFEEVDSNGISNYDKMQWDKVFQSFISWSKE